MRADVQVWKDTIAGAPHRGFKLDGKRFGELTVVRAVDRRDTSILWLCRCDCGRVALRTSCQLTRAERTGSSPSCNVCLAEMRGGQVLTDRARRAQGFVEMFVMFGALYNPERETLYEEEIKDELETLGLPRPDEEAPTSWGVAAPPIRQVVMLQQRAAYLAPMSGRTWRCECGMFFEEGFACVACQEPACPNCVKAEAHRCDATNIVPWESALTPARFYAVFEKGERTSGATYDDRAERFLVQKAARELQERLERQQKETQARMWKDEKQKSRALEESLRQRLRRLKKKHPWLAREMENLP